MIDSLKIPIVELGLAYAVSRVGAVVNIENINVVTLSYSLRKKTIQDRVNMSRLFCISLKIQIKNLTESVRAHKEANPQGTANPQELIERWKKRSKCARKEYSKY